MTHRDRNHVDLQRVAGLTRYRGATEPRRDIFAEYIRHFRVCFSGGVHVHTRLLNCTDAEGVSLWCTRSCEIVVRVASDVRVTRCTWIA